MASAKNKIPISVIIVTKNEEDRLPACLNAVQDFGEIIVMDSSSTDGTKNIASQYNAKVIDFLWNGQYPKKRQWCLDNIDIKHDFVFFVDADEIVTDALIGEIRAHNSRAAGYFIKGRYIMDGQPLKHGLQNNKLCLINRHKMEFPVIDDLDIEGMGEIEGHYQPVLKAQYRGEMLGQLHTPLIHDALHNWEERHKRYAMWEAGMNAKNAWPLDPSPLRQAVKEIFRALPCRGMIAFIHSYIWKMGFLDGARGLKFANMRRLYYKMIDRNTESAKNRYLQHFKIKC